MTFKSTIIASEEFTIPGGSQILEIYPPESAWQYKPLWNNRRKNYNFSECHGSKERCDSGIDCSLRLEVTLTLTYISVHQRAKGILSEISCRDLCNELLALAHSVVSITL